MAKSPAKSAVKRNIAAASRRSINIRPRPTKSKKVRRAG